MVAPILVTGATGTVGSEVLAALASRGLPVRAAARRPSTAPHDPGVVGTGRADLVEPVRFDFLDPATFSETFHGVETMFLVRPPALARLADLEPALWAAFDAGVRHVVLLSVQGADKLLILPHARLERWLAFSAMTWTFLRPSFFDQNLITVHGPTIRRQGQLVMPAGRGRTAFVDAIDVAEAAASVLAEPHLHRDRAYTLTGSEALTYGEVAGILTAVCGRPIRYEQPGLLRYLRTSKELALPPAMVAATAVIYSTARLGLAATLTDDLPRLLGRPTTTMTEFAHRERHTLNP